jgi:DNA-binding XRE family transcriptional regulator
MDENLPNPFPALLRHFRKKAGYSQAEVAKALSISRSGYGNYEEGRCLPNIEQTIKLSEMLNHDFLYAYTLSTRNARIRNPNSNAKELRESSTYITAIMASESTTQMLDNYKKLYPDDQVMVNNFVEMLSKKEIIE